MLCISTFDGNRLRRTAAALVAGTWLVSGAAIAQTAPAPAPTTAPRTATPAAKPATAVPRTRIELPAGERAALEAATAPAVPPAVPERNELLPQPDDAQLTIVEPSGTVVEQIRQSNRISEVRVTPAMTGHTWVMTNRDGRQPLSATETLPGGLSVPKFFTFEFGGSSNRAAGTAPAPTAPAPPPPSTQTR